MIASEWPYSTYINVNLDYLHAWVSAGYWVPQPTLLVQPLGAKSVGRTYAENFCSRFGSPTWTSLSSWSLCYLYLLHIFLTLMTVSRVRRSWNLFGALCRDKCLSNALHGIFAYLRWLPVVSPVIYWGHPSANWCRGIGEAVQQPTIVVSNTWS